MIPYTVLVPMKNYSIDVHTCSYLGTYCHTITVGGEKRVVMRVNGKLTLFFTYDIFMDADTLKKVEE